MHDTTKALLGATKSGFKVVDNHIGTIAAGKIVRLKSDDTISIALADGSAVGISIGRNLSNTARTSFVRRGTGVPVLLTAAFDPDIGAQVCIDDVTGIAKASGAGVTGVNAIFSSGRVGGTGVNGGIDEDGNTVGMAYIDFPGGL